MSKGGRDIHLPLGALISLGQPSDSTDTLALDATNIWVNQTDARTGMQNNKPMFRTTGMQVTVEIVYDNMVKMGIGAFERPSSNVTAQVEVSIEKAAWAGSGPLKRSTHRRRDSTRRGAYPTRSSPDTGRALSSSSGPLDAYTRSTSST